MAGGGIRVCVWKPKCIFLSDRNSSMRTNFPKSVMTLYLLTSFTSTLKTFFLIKATTSVAAQLTALQVLWSALLGSL